MLTITAERSYKLSLNGRFILSGNTVQRARRVDASSLLRSGTNELTVIVEESAEKRGQTALIASLAVCFKGEGKLEICTDRQWNSSLTELGSQSPAVEVGSFNMPPWKLDDSAIEAADIYPSYAVTAELLGQLGVERDFEADAEIRYIHRRDGAEDFYFLANGEDRPQRATCRFRVTGRQPEWWNAITGERRDLPEFAELGDRTEIPIELEAMESGFVVFRKPAVRSASKGGANFLRFETIATLAAPWEIAFDPKWGGPEQVTFSRLEDWSNRPEPGIRYYSGKAAYKTTFDCDSPDSRLRYFVALGRVANIASVKLNGRDLGVAWCAPWRLAIPDGLLQARGNVLDVVVANLWINRLIGDSSLPAEKRLAWITGNPFHPEDALLESGLLGPVTLQAH
jgi:hypothetical protein